MDTFRWSDGHSYAVEFQAQENGFVRPAMDALRSFHEATAKRYHDGKTRINMIHFREAQLHIQVHGNWRPLKHDGALVVYSITTENTPESIEEIYVKIEPEVLFKQQMIWRRVDAAYTNESRLIQFLNGFVDDLGKLTEDSE